MGVGYPTASGPTMMWRKKCGVWWYGPMVAPTMSTAIEERDVELASSTASKWTWGCISKVIRAERQC